jgi:hypothetical protein
MAKNQEGINGFIERLAILSDEIGKIFPDSKSVLVFSLNENDFNFAKTQINEFKNVNQFKIDISGIEFIFLQDGLLNNVEDRT